MYIIKNIYQISINKLDRKDNEKLNRFTKSKLLHFYQALLRQAVIKLSSGAFKISELNNKLEKDRI